jgi:23S rRNA (uracil1939-C5)-methyltransferase
VAVLFPKGRKTSIGPTLHARPQGPSKGPRAPAQPVREPRPERKRTPLLTATLRIDSLASGGDGVGRLESGEVVFLPDTAPGERVEAAVDLGQKPAQGRVLQILERSPDRVAPACAYVAICGGCDWMHLNVAAQERAHAALVEGSIRHASAGTAGAEVPVIVRHAAESPLGYRTRARLFVKIERGKLRIGYRAQGSHEVVQIDRCVVLHAAIAPVLGDLPVVLKGASGEGDAQIARGKGGVPVVDLAWRGEIPATTWAALDARVKAGTWAGARIRVEGSSLPAVFGDPRPFVDGADGAPLAIAAGGFAQPSDHGAAALARRVNELARLTSGPPGQGPLWKEERAHHVVELFAGSGTLSILLARDVASFNGIEIDEAAAECARQNFKARAIEGKFTVADADAFVIPPRAEIVVLDPPRSGAPGAVKAIVASSARAVVYVACDPPTLGRDLGALLRAGFVVTHVETFELFPQTSHVETVVRLVRVRPGNPAR